MHQSSLDKMSAFKDRYLMEYQHAPLKILDLGSQDVNGSYRAIFDDPAWCYTGLDSAPGRNVDIVLEDPYHWRPVRSASVNVVVSGQAFEHIEYYWVTMLEIARVLKPGGVCCIIAPSGGFEHRYPVDCWRFYPDGLRALSKYAGLDVLEAYYDQEPKKYNDGSEHWKDSVLIAAKPRWSITQIFLLNLKIYLSRFILRI